MAKPIDEENLRELYQQMVENRDRLEKYKNSLHPLTYSDIGEHFNDASRQTIQRAIKRYGIK